MERTLSVSIENFTKMLSGLIQAGVTFTAEDCNDNNENYIKITFTGGY